MDHLLLAIAKIVVLVLGGAIAALAVLAYRQTQDRSMLYLGAGFTFIAFGSFLEGLLFELLDWNLMTVRIVESGFVLAGLATLAVTLRPRRAQG